MRDYLETLEDACEARMADMSHDVPEGMFRCACGRVVDLGSACASSPSPFASPICPTCEGRE